MRILLIEDDRHYREFVQELLSANGYDVILADDGIVALDMLQEQAVDFILADVAMPRMNGYQLLACVSQNPLWAHIPFVFLSGRDLDSDIRYAEEMGIDGYLSKTAPVEDILAIVRGKLRRAQRYQQSQDIASVADGGQALQVGRLSVDLQKRRVWLDEQPI
ncbi:MAG: response regulator transcription factor, partial [Anaerolineales bacterium]|nr:response regulator transcription factor [Anaerolineales bacterium]